MAKRSLLLAFLLSTIGQQNIASVHAFSFNSKNEGASGLSRRAFFSGVTASTAAAVIVTEAGPSVANAAPEIFTTEKGVKYASLKMPSKPGNPPQQGDIVAVEYTGYLTDGEIFDATHAEGKNNALLFQLGTSAVIPGLNDMISQMVVGQKVQAIIPAKLAFAEKGLCLDDGECLIKPGSTLVYDIFLKKSSIPPP